jgi:hypothetical protein
MTEHQEQEGQTKRIPAVNIYLECHHILREFPYYYSEMPSIRCPKCMKDRRVIDSVRIHGIYYTEHDYT